MSALQYEIAMETPLGTRKGRLMLDIMENVCTGVLEMMREKNVVTGTISADGQCCLKGTIRTLLHARDFTADGTCRKDTAELILRCGRIRCLIHGRAVVM